MRRALSEYKSLRSKVQEYKTQAESASKTVRQLNVKIGKLERRGPVRGATPAPAATSDGAGPYTRTEADGKAFMKEHAALVQEIDALKVENERLLHTRDDASEAAVAAQVCLCYNVTAWVLATATEVLQITRPLARFHRMQRAQRRAIQDLEAELAAARTHIGRLSAQQHAAQGSTTTREASPASQTSSRAFSAPPARGAHPDHDVAERLGEAHVTASNQAAHIARLQGELATARNDIARWEAATLQPSDLEAIRRGHPEHERTLSRLTASVEQYTRLYQQAQARIQAMADKQQARYPRCCFRCTLLCCRPSGGCIAPRWCAGACTFSRTATSICAVVQEVTGMLERTHGELRDAKDAAAKAEAGARQAEALQREVARLQEDVRRRTAAHDKAQEDLLNVRACRAGLRVGSTRAMQAASAPRGACCSFRCAHTSLGWWHAEHAAAQRRAGGAQGAGVAAEALAAGGAGGGVGAAAREAAAHRCGRAQQGGVPRAGSAAA